VITKETTNVTYPSDAPELVPGVTYSWVLETTDPLVFPPLRSEAAFFEVLSMEEKRQVDASLGEISETRKPGESTYHFVCASVYYEHGLMDDAISETSLALEIDPDNTALHAILARLYAETGRSEEALREYDRLLEQR
jgi:tetratricopeptide (TPR) repeat protein